MPGSSSQAHRELSSATVRRYAAAWSAFQVWCHAQDAVCLPATLQTVAAYLEACAGRLGPSGLRAVLAALAHHHRGGGQSWPAGDPIIARTLADLQARASRPREAATFGTDELRRLVATCDGAGEGAAGLRTPNRTV